MTDEELRLKLNEIIEVVNRHDQVLDVVIKKIEPDIKPLTL